MRQKKVEKPPVLVLQPLNDLRPFLRVGQSETLPAAGDRQFLGPAQATPVRALVFVESVRELQIYVVHHTCLRCGGVLIRGDDLIAKRG